VPSFSRVDSDEERKHYRSQLLRLWKVPKRLSSRDGFFPACNPKSVARANLSSLHSHPYLVSHKSDGVRYILLLTLRPKVEKGAADQPVALMIDRAYNMFEVEVVAHEDFFVAGTILEGELVWKQPDEKSFLYLVFDAILVRGEHLMHRPFEARLAAASSCIHLSEELSALTGEELEQQAVAEGSVVLCHYNPSVRMRMKKFVPKEFAVRLWGERGEAEHRVDGLILQRSDSEYVFGTANDGSVFKWKEHSTVDLQGFDFRAADGAFSDISFPTTVATDSRIQPLHDADVIEYLVQGSRSDVRLFAVRRRPDKKLANGMRVVNATIQDAVVDFVRVEELSQS